MASDRAIQDVVGLANFSLAPKILGIEPRNPGSASATTPITQRASAGDGHVVSRFAMRNCTSRRPRIQLFAFDRSRHSTSRS